MMICSASPKKKFAEHKKSGCPSGTCLTTSSCFSRDSVTTDLMTEVDFSATKLQLPKIDDNLLSPRNNLIENRGTQE
jgi:hypothetical protein